MSPCALSSLAAAAARALSAAYPRAACATGLLLLAGLGLPACSSTSENPRPDSSVLNEEAPRWVYDPAHDWDAAHEPFAYYATGQAPIHANLNLAEENARADALVDVQSFLTTSVERLTENWAVESGDLLEPAALSSLVKDEMFTRTVVSGTLNGTRVVGKWYDGRNYYVRVKYNAEDAFLGSYVKGFSRKLADQTRELTGAERDRMRAELERVVRELNER